METIKADVLIIGSGGAGLRAAIAAKCVYPEDNIYRAAERIGKGSKKYTVTVKKQEAPAHEPRGKWGVGLGYAVSPT